MEIYCNDSSGVSSTLNEGGDLTAGDLTITLTDASSFPTAGRILIGSEIITYSSKAGNNLTVDTRGAAGTTAAVHSDGASVYTITGSGTAGDPYTGGATAYHKLALSILSSGDVCIFDDGTYNFTLNPEARSGITLRAKNIFGPVCTYGAVSVFVGDDDVAGNGTYEISGFHFKFTNTAYIRTRGEQIDFVNCKVEKTGTWHGSGQATFYDNAGGTAAERWSQCLFVYRTLSHTHGQSLFNGPGHEFYNCTMIMLRNVTSNFCDSTSAIFQGCLFAGIESAWGDIDNASLNSKDNWCFNCTGTKPPHLGTSDPLFIDTDNEDYRLRPNSPCINHVADPTGIFFELSGASGGAGSFADPYKWPADYATALAAASPGDVFNFLGSASSPVTYPMAGANEPKDSIIFRALEPLGAIFNFTDGSGNLLSGPATLEDVYVHSNYTASEGQPVGYESTFNRCVIENVSAGNRGLNGTGGVVIFNECLLKNARGQLGYTSYDSEYNYCTFELNVSLGSRTIHGALKNCIFYSATANPTALSIFTSNSANENNWFYNFTNVTAAHADVIGDTDPMFIDPDNGDFRLRPESPCLNKGL